MNQANISQPPLAIIADIHGNRWALQAVLQNIDRRVISQIVNLGDHLTGPLDPAGTADLLIERGMLSICGNDDRVLFAPVEELSASQRLTSIGCGHYRKQPWLPMNCLSATVICSTRRTCWNRWKLPASF